MKKYILIFILLNGLVALGMEKQLVPKSVCCPNRTVQDIPIANPELLFKWYSHLSPEEKSFLRQKFDKSLRVDSLGDKGTIMHPLVEEKSLRLLVANAKKLLKAYPNDRIFGLGQTPAYILETAKIIKFFRGQAVDNIEKIAFSGRFVKLIEDGYSRYYTKNKVQPTKSQLNSYKVYLTKLGLHPSAIINSYDSENLRKTVIIDFTDTGSGLASFLDILLQWAKGLDCSLKLVRALRVGVFVSKRSIASLEFLGFPKIFDVNTKFIERLGNSDLFKDRLVPNYPFLLWQWKNPLRFSPSDNAKLMMFNIMDYIITKKLRHGKI